ncbi:MAG: NAD(P)/FAD-dependent oxidoreductase [Lachnospiraceae bacterium]
MEVYVIGAGAAGLMAAVSAADAGAAVTLLETMEKPGKKISITGNGRCNLTNRDIQDANFYFSDAPEDCRRHSESIPGERYASFF